MTTVEGLRKLATANGKLAERVTLPACPSANNLFATFNGRRIKSREYKAWLDRATPLLAILAPPASYPCRYRMHLAGKWNVLRDGQNVEKATIDASVAAGVITDDSLKYVHGGEWTYEKGDSEPTVTVWFEPLPAAA
jgi:hypothetical protein